LEYSSLGRAKSDASIYFRSIGGFVKDSCCFGQIWIEWLVSVTLGLIGIALL